MTTKPFVAIVLVAFSKIKAMSSKYIIVIVALLMGTVATAQTTRSKKSPIKTAKGSTKPKTITEAEAKRLHEAQMAKEGNTGVRKAYKRNEMTDLQSAEDLALDDKTTTHKPEAAIATPKAVMPPKNVEVVTVAEPKPLRFIESIVLERKEG